jgi:hypothetical protein
MPVLRQGCDQHQSLQPPSNSASLSNVTAQKSFSRFPNAHHILKPSAGATAMKGDSKVIEFLNEALKNELTAINQYWLHYRCSTIWASKSLPNMSGMNRLTR